MMFGEVKESWWKISLLNKKPEFFYIKCIVVTNLLLYINVHTVFVSTNSSGEKN